MVRTVRSVGIGLAEVWSTKKVQLNIEAHLWFFGFIRSVLSMSPQILRHNEIYAIPLTDAHVAVEVDDGGGAGGVVAEAAVGRAVLDKAVGQHRDAGVVANDGDGVVTFPLDQIEDCIGARVIEHGFEIDGGIAA